MTREELNAEMVIATIAELKGNVSAVARKFKMSRPTLYKYIEAHPSVKAALDSERETMLDNAESALYRAVIDGQAWAVCFFLKTQGKSRGYIERSEVTGKDGGAIVIDWGDGSTSND
jgi:hypothetical protein